MAGWDWDPVIEAYVADVDTLEGVEPQHVDVCRVYGWRVRKEDFNDPGMKQILKVSLDMSLRPNAKDVVGQMGPNE